MTVSKSLSNYLTYRPKNCWRSVDAPLTLILGGSHIVTKNIANNGGQYFDYGLMLLHWPWIMQDIRPWIVDAPLTQIVGGSDIVSNNIAIKSGQYVGYA